MLNEYIYLYLFNLLLVIMLFHDYRNAPYMPINLFMGSMSTQIIQQWEENGKPKGISLEDYINTL